jgi:hypothetical protein
MVSVFCEKLGWTNFGLLVNQFQTRLHFGVSQELCDVMRVSTLDNKTARSLFDAGVKSCADLAASHPATVEKHLLTAGPFSK